MMKSAVPLPGGDLEYAVLRSLWELGRASAREIYGRVGEPSDLVYTTITKVLDRLYAKGLVSRKQEDRRFVYEPKIPRHMVEAARAKLTLGKLIGPEPRPAMATLVEAVESIDPALLDDLSRAIAARRRLRRGS